MLEFLSGNPRVLSRIASWKKKEFPLLCFSRGQIQNSQGRVCLRYPILSGLDWSPAEPELPPTLYHYYYYYYFAPSLGNGFCY